MKIIKILKILKKDLLNIVVFSNTFISFIFNRNIISEFIIISIWKNILFLFNHLKELLFVSINDFYEFIILNKLMKTLGEYIVSICLNFKFVLLILIDN